MRPAATLLSTGAAALVRVVLVALITLLAGCASLPPRSAQPPSYWQFAAADTPLGGLPALHRLEPGQSGFRPLLEPLQALQTRLALIQQARVGIDLQTYHLGNDATGRELLHALADAADRGVRVRLLVDDLHTIGLTDLLLGLAAHAGAEVRLYNPFPIGRDSLLLRLFSLVGDFSQLNRRMHNKLMVADGHVAIFGGRNLTDAYFLRGGDANFLDIELLGLGRVAADLLGGFDHYWNSPFAVPVQALADNPLDAAQRRAGLQALTAATAPAMAAGASAAAAELATLALRPAEARVYWDDTAKTAGGVGSPGGGPPLPVGRLVRAARERLVVVSPYFLPSETGVKLMRDARERGVAVLVLTNSLIDTDEPLVSLAYGRRRHDFLRAGLRLFEMSSDKLKADREFRLSMGSAVARLHAKLGLIDDRLVLIGSMNIDPRSAHTNTELALVIDSPELVRELQIHFQPTLRSLAHEVRLAADGASLVWVTVDAQGQEQLSPEPSLPPWRLLLLWLMSRFVSDDLL